MTNDDDEHVSHSRHEKLKDYNKIEQIIKAHNDVMSILFVIFNIKHQFLKRIRQSSTSNLYV